MSSSSESFNLITAGSEKCVNYRGETILSRVALSQPAPEFEEQSNKQSKAKQNTTSGKVPGKEPGKREGELPVPRSAVTDIPRSRSWAPSPGTELRRKETDSRGSKGQLRLILAAAMGAVQPTALIAGRGSALPYSVCGGRIAGAATRENAQVGNGPTNEKPATALCLYYE
ncbi:hypothetical protein TARUN_5964 [Trichoderma arundinaceum]|uniref:Uncharacterized protein n=1 Tax=Trichoderma arundinaceum TaxID=490622 RepID=A0A395NK42_TRIAR|nr:hypothetical protein TARUN_5964 [Trichoderma arundinaceum]